MIINVRISALLNEKAFLTSENIQEDFVNGRTTIVLCAGRPTMSTSETPAISYWKAQEILIAISAVPNLDVDFVAKTFLSKSGPTAK